MVAVTCVTTLSSCTSWRLQPLLPRDLIAREQPPQLRVTRFHGARVVLLEPHIVGDTLFGYSHRALSGVGLGDVALVAVRKPDTGKTIALMGGVRFAAGVALAAAVAASGGVCCGW